MSEPSLAGRLESLDRLARLAAIRDDQQRRWRMGERVQAEDYFRQVPGLADDPELALDIVYSEILLRAQLNETVTEEEYTARFPDRAESLCRLFVLFRHLHPRSVELSATLTTLPAASRATLPIESSTQPVVERYELCERLGEGAMGVVWKARHTALKRWVALKLLRSDRAPDLTRFQAEAEAIGRLQHPHIVQVYDVGIHQGAPYLVQEYVAGGTLAGRLREGPLAPQKAAALVAALALGIQHAHDRNVIHRDLKPANVLLQAGEDVRGDQCEGDHLPFPDPFPRIADFGLAKRLDEAPLTRTGYVLGTPSYMSPEQASGNVKAIGRPADIYSLGAILYECLTGQPPFRASSIFETLHQVRNDPPVPPRRRCPAIPAFLEAICLKCLEKEPARRYGSALALAEDLQRFLAEERLPGESVAPSPRRRYAGAALAVLLALGWVMFLLGLTGTVPPREDRSAEGEARPQTKGLEPFDGQVDREYRILLSDLAMRADSRQLGWTGDVLSRLAHLSQHPLPGRDREEEQRLAVRALGGLDLGPACVLLQRADVSCLAFSPSGNLLAVALEGEQESVRILDLNGKLVQALSFPPRPGGRKEGEVILRLAFSADGGWLAGGTREGLVHLWSLAEQEPPAPRTFHLKQGPVSGVAFSQDAQSLFAASGGEKGMYRWSLHQPSDSFRVEMPTPNEGLAAWADNRLISTSAGECRLLDSTRLQPVGVPVRQPGLRGPLAGSAGLIASPERGGRIALLSPGGPYLADWLPKSGTAGAHRAPADSLSLSRTGALLLSACSDAADRQVKLWEVVSGRLLLEWSPGNEGRLLAALDPNGHAVAVAANRSLTLRRVVRPGHQAYRAVQAGLIASFALTSSGQIVQIAHSIGHPPPFCRGLSWLGPDGERGLVGLWRLDARFERDRCTLVPHPRSEEGVVYRYGENNIKINKPDWSDARVDVATGVEVDCLAVDPEGQRVWGNAGLKGVDSWKWGTAERASTWNAGVRIACLAAGRKWVLAGGEDGRLHFLDPVSGQPRQPGLFLGSVALTHVALSPDGELAGVGTANGDVILVDLSARAVRMRLASHAGPVTMIDFRDDGALFASGGGDGTVRVHRRAGDGFHPLVLLPLDAPVSVVRFHPDRKHLVVLLRGERGLRSWDLDRLLDSLTGLGLHESLPVRLSSLPSLRSLR